MRRPINWDYKDRSVEDWLVVAESGQLKLPSFQRSYVWNSKRIADYLLALFQEKPTGVFLVLKTEGELTFESRSLKKVDSASSIPAATTELLLDGQQRMTSLWQALAGAAEESYFAEFKDLSGPEIRVGGVKFMSGLRAEQLKNAQEAYTANLVPIRILRNASNNADEQVWRWCRSAIKDADEASSLRRRNLR